MNPSPYKHTIDSEELSLAEQNVWIVIPAFNEESRIRSVLKEVNEVKEVSETTLRRQVVVVDDGSTDRTSQVVLRFNTSIYLVRHKSNLGQGAALRSGVQFALRGGAQVVVTFDGDGQHSCKDISRLIEPIIAGKADVVLGSRFLGTTKELPAIRWAILKLGVFFTRTVLRLDVTDTHNGLRALSRRAAQKIRFASNRMGHAFEILEQIHAHRLDYCEVPVTIRYTDETLQKGQRSWNGFGIVIQYLIRRVFGHPL